MKRMLIIVALAGLSAGPVGADTLIGASRQADILALEANHVLRARAAAEAAARVQAASQTGDVVLSPAPDVVRSLTPGQLEKLISIARYAHAYSNDEIDVDINKGGGSADQVFKVEGVTDKNGSMNLEKIELSVDEQSDSDVDYIGISPQGQITEAHYDSYCAPRNRWGSSGTPYKCGSTSLAPTASRAQKDIRVSINFWMEFKIPNS